MSIYNALYGRDGHGVGPNEPEKKGFARFCQMVGRDLGQLLGTNLMVCVLCLPAALGVSLGVTLLSLPLTVVCSAVTGLLTGPAMVLLADCALRSLQNDPYGRLCDHQPSAGSTVRQDRKQPYAVYVPHYGRLCGLLRYPSTGNLYPDGWSVHWFHGNLWLYWNECPSH